MYSIDLNTHNQIMTYLGDVPAKFANPLISLLLNMKNQQEVKPEETINENQ